MRWFGRRDKDLEEEIRAHIDIETQENLERGLSSAEARRAAERAFGNIGVVRERIREQRPGYWLDTFLADLRFGGRSLRKNPALSCAILLTLTFGIGLNTVAFTIIAAELFRVPVDDPDSFAGLFPEYSGEGARGTRPGRLCYTDFRAYQAGVPALREVAAWHSDSRLLGDDASDRVPLLEVSCNYFALFGPSRARLGRFFAEEECSAPGSAPVAVLSEEVWRDRFASDPNIVGRIIHLDRHPFTVIGVAPRPPVEQARTSLWIPYTMAASSDRRRDLFAEAGRTWLSAAGRLQPGSTRADAQVQLAVVASQQDRLYADRKTTLRVTNGSTIEQPDALDKFIWPLTLVMGSVTLILVIVCLNASMLLLARAAVRRREIAVRLSLGAGQFRLLRMLLTESLVPAGLAGLAGAWLAHVAPLALAKAIGLPAGDYSPDWRVFAHLATISTLAGCVAGLAPALEALKVDLTASLKCREGLGPALGRWGPRDLLAGAQVALSLVLLAAGGFILRATHTAFLDDPGFETRKVLVVMSTMRMPPYTPEAAQSFYRNLEQRVRALPAVESVGFATSVRSGNPVEVKLPGQAGAKPRLASHNDVSPGFFETLSIPIVRGRIFTEREAAVAKARVTIVSESLARTLWPGEEPLGKRIEDAQGNLLEVIGVSRDTRSWLFHSVKEQFYRPRHPRSDDDDLLVRFTGDAGAIQQAVRSAIRDLDPAMLPAPQTIDSMIEGQARVLRRLAGAVLLLAGLTVLLIMLGLHGMVGFAATQRTREFGIRMALGATKADVFLLVLRSGAKTVLGGLGIGFLLAPVASRVLTQTFRNERFQVATNDPVVYVVVALLVVLVAGTAMFGPARRAAASDPVRALRQD